MVVGLDPLLVARAGSELGERRLLRAVAEAGAEGRSQRDIAGRLGLSQSSVFKMLRTARVVPGRWQVTPWEIALRYAAGEIDREVMLKEFSAWPWTVSRMLDADSEWPEQFVRGDWDDLEEAVRAGYLTLDDYEVVLNRPRR